jgi:hypothetical protein
MPVSWRSLPALACAASLLAACGSGTATTASATNAPSTAASAPGTAQTASDWPEFGLTAQRSNSSDAPTGIGAANVAKLGRHVVALPGIADSSPIYLHGVTVGGATGDVFAVTTTYGRTLAIDARTGRILWQFVPPGIGSWEGGHQITTATPIADPDRRFLYAVSPNGLVHKLELANGSEAPGWPARVTLLPAREKIAPALNIDGASLIVATGGYYGDQPPYQGHVVEISRATGRITGVFNTLCANRRGLIVPSSCPASGSAIWSRAGAAVEPGTGRLLVVTGNGPYDGSTNFGDSLLELNPNGLALRQAYTPTNQSSLANSDTDLGSGGPALLPGGLVLIGGKDGLLRLLDLHRLNGHNLGRPFPTGGTLQVLRSPGGGRELFTEPAVWHNTVFVADGGGTAAYTVAGRRLRLIWQNGRPGSSPVVAGGLLYVYDVVDGGLNVYDARTGRRITTLPAGPGHWNSPAIAGGRIALPEGGSSADDATHGTLDLYF